MTVSLPHRLAILCQALGAQPQVALPVSFRAAGHSTEAGEEKKGWPRAGCEVASGLGWGWGPCLRSPYLVLAASAAPVGGHTTRDKLPPSFLLWHGLRVPPPDLTVDSNFVPLLSGSGRTTDSLNTHTDKLEKGEEGMGPLEQRTTIIPGTLGD